MLTILFCNHCGNIDFDGFILQRYRCQRDLSFNPSRIVFLTCQSDWRLFRQEKALGSAERLAGEGLAQVGPMAESPDVHGAMQIQSEELRRFRMNGGFKAKRKSEKEKRPKASCKVAVT